MFGLGFDPVRATDGGRYTCLINNRPKPDAVIKMSVLGESFILRGVLDPRMGSNGWGGGREEKIPLGNRVVSRVGGVSAAFEIQFNSSLLIPGPGFGLAGLLLLTQSRRIISLREGEARCMKFSQILPSHPTLPRI